MPKLNKGDKFVLTAEMVGPREGYGESAQDGDFFHRLSASVWSEAEVAGFTADGSYDVRIPSNGEDFELDPELVDPYLN